MFFNDWVDVLLFRAQSKLASITLSEGLKNLVIAALILGFLSGVESFLAIPFVPVAEAGFWAGLGIGIIPLYTILFPIIYLISIFISGSIINFTAKILGGRGNSGNLIGALALIAASFSGTIYVLLTVINIAAALFGFEIYSLAVLIAMIIGFLAELWQLVLIIKTTKQIHQLSTGMAILAIFGLAILLIIILAILAIIAGVMVYPMARSPTGMALLPF